MPTVPGSQSFASPANSQIEGREISLSSWMTDSSVRVLLVSDLHYDLRKLDWLLARVRRSERGDRRRGPRR